MDIVALSNIASNARVTHTLCLPSLYDAILQYAEPKSLQYLRVAMVAGERCPPEVCRRHEELLPSCAFHNEYGPTEATVWSTVWEAHADSHPIPIGRPIPGAEVRVMGPNGKEMPVGLKGEIWASGPGLVEGYLDKPGENDPFVELDDGRRFYRTGDLGAWNEDGDLLFFGRRDEQLKVRGYRIEPGEIEGVLIHHPAVAEAGVVAGGEGQLVAAVVADRKVDTETLRDFLAERLPDHMMPTFIGIREE